jgi:WD40 repeat protein
VFVSWRGRSRFQGWPAIVVEVKKVLTAFVVVIVHHVTGMYSMPAVAVHPSNKFMVLQSLDNTIVTYSARDRFRIMRNKVFKGHLGAGYACQVNFSPDGAYVLSGDSDGHVFIWDWKTTKVYRCGPLVSG